MIPKYNLQVFPSVNALSMTAAEFIIDTADRSIRERGRFVIALSGGHTPEKLYALMAGPLYHDRMPWARTYVWWGDERCVPTDDPRNNARMATTLLLDKIDIPAANIHPVLTYLSPVSAAEAYEEELNIFFGNDPKRFDLILLGLGTNGHTASLFPGTDIVSEKAAGIREIYLKDDDMHRITMTAPLINLARNILFLVAGTDKAAILKTVLTGAYDPALYPAQLIQPEADALHWYVDKDAADEMK